jgi:hypothetical protein
MAQPRIVLWPDCSPTVGIGRPIEFPSPEDTAIAAELAATVVKHLSLAVDYNGKCVTLAEALEDIEARQMMAEALVSAVTANRG